MCKISFEGVLALKRAGGSNNLLGSSSGFHFHFLCQTGARKANTLCFEFNGQGSDFGNCGVNEEDGGMLVVKMRGH